MATASQLVTLVDDFVGGGGQLEALDRLIAAVDKCYGDEAVLLAEALRARGGVALLVSLIADGSSDLHVRAMSVVGNVVAEVFEPRAADTLDAVMGGGGLDAIAAHLHSPYPSNVYAAATLQNITGFSLEACEHLHANGALKALEELLNDDDPALAEFASGALANLHTNLGETLGPTSGETEAALNRRRALDVAAAMQQRSAAKVMQRSVRAFSARRLRRRSRCAPAAPTSWLPTAERRARKTGRRRAARGTTEGRRSTGSASRVSMALERRGRHRRTASCAPR